MCMYSLIQILLDMLDSQIFRNFQVPTRYTWRLRRARPPTLLLLFLPIGAKWGQVHLQTSCK